MFTYFRFSVQSLSSLALLACSVADPGDGSTGTTMTGDVGSSGGSDSGSSGGASTGAGGGTASSGGADGTLAAGGSMVGSGGVGMDAAGGSQGSGASDGSGGAASSGAGCAEADIFCETFESYTGMRPSGGMWIADPCMNNTNYSASVEAGAGPDASAAYVTSGASTGSNYCVLMTDLGEELPTEFWLTAAIKIGGTDPDLEHEVTFLELGPEEGDASELRIGYRGDSSCAVQGFELGALEGPGGEYTGCTGLKPVADKWYCLETHIDQSGGSGTVSQLYVNDVLQDYNVHGMTKETVLSNSTPRFLKVGMQSYGGEFGSLVIDQLSVSSTRVGCN